MALRLSDPLEEHVAKQQAGSGERIAERQLATDRLQGLIAPFTHNHLDPLFLRSILVVVGGGSDVEAHSRFPAGPDQVAEQGRL